VCCGEDKETVTACVFFLGSYLILQRGTTVDSVTQLFLPVSDKLDFFKDPYQQPIDSPYDRLTVHDGWRSLQKARDNGWVYFLDDDVEHEGSSCIDMEEFLHYDSPANGRLHVVVPSELMVFQCPSNLLLPESDHRHWADVGGERHFTPAFYADVLGTEYGVQLVVRCDNDTADPARYRASVHGMEGARTRAGYRPPVPPPAPATYDPAAFFERRIAVERLAAAPPAAGGGALLRDVDRFLTLTRLAPGPVALHGPGVGLGPGGEVLATALLVQRHGFDGRAALAWLRITHPAAPPPLLALSGPAASSTVGAVDRACDEGVTQDLIDTN
jgi:hypothetical protein